MNVPTDLRYTKSHEWVRVDGNVATIGITDHAQSELGDIVYLDLAQVDKTLAPGDTFGSVESVKTVSDVYSPVNGVVVEMNSDLSNSSELVNSDPYGAGWLIKVKLSNPADLENLLDDTAYTAEIS